MFKWDDTGETKEEQLSCRLNVYSPELSRSCVPPSWPNEAINLCLPNQNREPGLITGR